MPIYQWTIPGAEGELILGDTHTPPDEIARGNVVIAHGFRGYKDYGILPFLAERLTQRGLVAHRFNFSHSGMTNRLETFERPDLFERDTFTKQIHDLAAVHRSVIDGTIPGGAGGKPIVWFGHSRGGITALLLGARAFEPARFGDADIQRSPDGVITAGAPDRPLIFDDEQIAELRRHSHLNAPSSRTGQLLRIGRGWLDEIDAAPQRFDPVAAAAAIRCPLLIVHGDVDATVPVASAHALAQAAGEPVKLVVIRGGNHVFNAPNPLPNDYRPAEMTRAFLDAVCDFAEACCVNA